MSLDILEKANMPPQQARAIVEVIDIELDARQDTLATKADLSHLRADVKTDIGNLRSELKADIGDLRTELKADVSNLRAELKADIADLRALLYDIKGQLEVQIQTVRSEMVRWVFTVFLGQTIVLCGAIYFIVNTLVING